MYAYNVAKIKLDGLENRKCFSKAVFFESPVWGDWGGGGGGESIERH